MLKAITGGDSVRHERKNQQQDGAFVFGGVVVIASNEPIQSTDYSSGLARRRLPVSFLKKVTDDDKEKWRCAGGIENAMRAELPGLLNWVLSMPDDEFSKITNGINTDLSKAERRHLVETNKLANWIDDNLIPDTNSVLYIGAVPNDSDDYKTIERDCATKLYPNNFKWCAENGYQAIAPNKFKNNVVDIAEHCKLSVREFQRDSKGKKVAGFRIRTPADEAVPTTIVKEILSGSAALCCTSADVRSPAGRMSVDSAANAGIFDKFKSNKFDVSLNDPDLFCESNKKCGTTSTIDIHAGSSGFEATQVQHSAALKQNSANDRGRL